MYAREIIGLVISLIYALCLIGMSELLYRKLDVPQFYTRKFVHIWAGMWTIAIMMLFYRWWIGIIPFAIFTVANYLLYYFRVVKSIDQEDSSPGAAYFALAVTVVFALLWRPIGQTDDGMVIPDYGPVAAAAIMVLTWGDSLAAIGGRLLGRHPYTIWGSTRSVEGSVVMAVVSFAAIYLTLGLISGNVVMAPFAPVLSMPQLLIAATVGALLATVAEGVTPAGLDNLTVPFVTAGVLWLLVR